MRRLASRSILSMVAALFATIPALALAAEGDGLRAWLETDRRSYGPGEPVRVALCLRNEGDGDIGLFVGSETPSVSVGGTGAPSESAAGEPRELVVRKGETRVLRADASLRGLGLAAGAHTVVASLAPIGAEELRAESVIELLPLQQDLRVGDIVAGPNVWGDGDLVELRGEYRGREARAFRPLAGVPAPRLTDWILGDESGEIYVRNRPQAEGQVPRPAWAPEPPDAVDLHPGWSYGKRVVVRGRVVREPGGSVVIDPVSVFKWNADRGAFCVVETSTPTRGGEHAGELMIRMLFENDTKYPVRIASPAGNLCDFVVERDGAEVWRWSRHVWTGQGIRWTRVEDESWRLRTRPEDEEDASIPVRDLPLLNIPPDNSIVRVAWWPLTDNAGSPVPPGVYSISAVLSQRVFSYPVFVEVGGTP